jgi:hypothetical protein
MLKYVGNFIELGYDDHPNPPSLVQLRGKRKPDNKEQVVAYLLKAPVLIMSPGREEDVLDPSKRAGSASVLTDGVYAWPKTLAHYVQTYDVWLPDEFESHMQRKGWKVPDAIDRLAYELPRY